jgi:hypothetical protein
MSPEKSSRRSFLKRASAVSIASVAILTDRNQSAEAKIRNIQQTTKAITSTPEYAISSYTRLESASVQTYRHSQFTEQQSQLAEAENAPGNQYFQRVWDRTDKPVAEGRVSRTWMWGPAFTDTMQEDYVEGESPMGKRTVQYFDKSRMEITHPNTSDPDGIWYVTNGLLVNELISGRMQLGDNAAEHYKNLGPAEVNVAGDADDTQGPTYKSFQQRLERETQSPAGYINTKRINREGSVTDDPSLAARNVGNAEYRPETGHNIARPFWDFMNSEGQVFENGQFVNKAIFETAAYATGWPISEPYWSRVKVAGTYKDVLIQCFERRVLTYTPDNPEGWDVEAGNVGQHYYRWRYEQVSEPDFPRKIGDVNVDHAEMNNTGNERGVVGREMDITSDKTLAASDLPNSWQKVVQTAQEFFPNEKFAFYFYDRAEDVPDDPRGANAPYDPIVYYSSWGAENGKQMRIQNSQGIWEKHISLPSNLPTEKRPELDGFITSAILRFFFKKDIPSAEWPAGFEEKYNEQVRDFNNTSLKIIYSK